MYSNLLLTQFYYFQHETIIVETLKRNYFEHKLIKYINY